MPENNHDSNNILIIISSFIVQGILWLTDALHGVTLDGIKIFGNLQNITFNGLFKTIGTLTVHEGLDLCYDFLKIAALFVSIWASYRVAKKHK